MEKPNFYQSLNIPQENNITEAENTNYCNGTCIHGWACILSFLHVGEHKCQCCINN